MPLAATAVASCTVSHIVYTEHRSEGKIIRHVGVGSTVLVINIDPFYISCVYGGLILVKATRISRKGSCSETVLSQRRFMSTSEQQQNTQVTLGQARGSFSSFWFVLRSQHVKVGLLLVFFVVVVVVVFVFFWFVFVKKKKKIHTYKCYISNFLYNAAAWGLLLIVLRCMCNQIYQDRKRQVITSNLHFISGQSICR